MKRRPRLVIVGLILLLAVTGCTKSSSTGGSSSAEGSGNEIGELDRPTILRNVLKLIRDAPMNPGGNNFDIATENLNDYFLNNKSEDFDVPSATMQFLQGQSFPADLITSMAESVGERKFLRNDGRHIEDNLLYHAVATRVAGEGDDLTRVKRLFEWTVRQVMLVPPLSLVPTGTPPAQARPYDVLLRGMAVEDQRSGWSERGWLFIALCRQLGIDAGIVVYTPNPNRGPIVVDIRVPPPKREPRTWAVCALVDGKPYLFDPALGLPIPSADGRGVATLEEAATDPAVLARLDIPGRGYEPSQADLASRPVKILLESSFGSLSSRMKLLQRDLAGQNRIVLYRDPLEQVDAFQKAIGPRCGAVDLWSLPLLVEHNLFHDSTFVRSTQMSLVFFDSKLPLLGARLDQLRGDLPAAMQAYVVFRFNDKSIESDGKTPISPDTQHVLDVFATYFLALAQEEKGDTAQAKLIFEQTLKMLPETGRRMPYFTMFRWGAETNLGLLNGDDHNPTLASRYLTRDLPTPQSLGNLIRARSQIWNDPFLAAPQTAPEADASASPKTAAGG